MVRIENIQSNANIISMDCYMEGQEEQHFYLELDDTAWEIITNTLNEVNSYVAHAKHCIKQYRTAGKALPNRTISMWY